MACPSWARSTDCDHSSHADRGVRLPLSAQCKDQAIAEISREHVHDVQGALLARGLSKATVDGAIASLSAVLGYALREHRIESNPARGARVDPADTRLQPVRPRQERRWIPPDEAGHLLDAVNPRYWELVLAPFLCGARPEESVDAAVIALVATIERAPRYPTDREMRRYGPPGLEHAARRFGGNRARAARLGLFIRPRWDAESAARAVSDLVERLSLGTYPTQRQFVEAHASGLYRAIANRLGGHEAMAARLGMRLAHRRR